MILKFKNIRNDNYFGIVIGLCIIFSCEYLAAKPKNKINTDSLISIINSSLSKEDYLAIANTLYQSDSSNKEYALYAAKGFKLMNEDTRSEYYLSKTLKKDSLYLPALDFKAQQFIDAGKLQEAEMQIEIIARYFPTEQATHLLQAKYFFALKNWEEAKQHVSKALELNNNLCESKILNALILMQLEAYKDAAENFIACISEVKYNATYLNNYGVCLLKTGKFDEALLIFKSAIKIDSSQYLYHYNLGLAQMKLEDFEAASKSFEKTKQLSDTIDLHLLEAICFEQQHRFDDAVKAYKAYQKNNGAENVTQSILMLEAILLFSKYWYYLLAAIAFAIAIVALLVRRKN